MPYQLQCLRALIETHPDRGAPLLRHVEALEATISSEPSLCLHRVRTLFEALHATIAPTLGIDFGEVVEFPARTSRIIKTLDFAIPGHPEQARINGEVAKLLGAINGAASALAALSNIPNLRHGGSLDWGTLQRQHAVMLGGFCDTLAAFLFDVAWSRSSPVATPAPAPDRYEDFPAFNAWLDDEHDAIEIAGAAFAPSRVLHALDPTTYDTARAEWEADQAAPAEASAA